MANYHPIKRDQEIKDTNDIQRLLKYGKFMTIAFASGNIPYIVTLSYGYAEEESSAYFHCSPRGMKSDFILNNPEVCATIIQDHGYLMGQCEHEYESLVLRGKIKIVKDKMEKIHGMSVIMKHLEYRPDPIKSRVIESDDVYNRMMILKLEVSSIVGKRSRDYKEI